MTPKELAALPVGSLVSYEGDLGEITRAGNEVVIVWEDGPTTIIPVNGPGWQKLIEEMKEEEL